MKKVLALLPAAVSLCAFTFPQGRAQPGHPNRQKFRKVQRSIAAPQ